MQTNATMFPFGRGTGRLCRQGSGSLWFAVKSKILPTPSNGQIADHGTVKTYQPELANLRDLAPLRGVEGKTPVPVDMTRGHLALTLYPPAWSEPGSTKLKSPNSSISHW